jgi:hypothetical protein
MSIIHLRGKIKGLSFYWYIVGILMISALIGAGFLYKIENNSSEPLNITEFKY